MPKKQDLPDPASYHSIIDGLKTIYKKKIKPIEETYKYDAFHSAIMTVYIPSLIGTIVDINILWNGV